MEEPSIDEAVEIIRGIAPYYEAFHKVTISPDMCRLAVTMSERYITDRYLPDKAIDLIDEAASDVNLHNKDLARLAEIDKELADYAKEMEIVLAATSGKDDPRVSELAQREQRLQRQKDTLEMAVSRDDAEAPNRGRSGLPGEAGRPPPPNRRPSAPAHRSGRGKAGDSE